MTSIPTRIAALFALAAALAVSTVPNSLQAQGTLRHISLDDALRLAETQSEAVQIARAGVTRATGQQYQARSQFLPQLNGSFGYIKTLKSQFQDLSFGGGPDTSSTPQPSALCAPRIPETATPAERAAALAEASTCSSGGGIDFSQTGFGAENQWTIGLQFSQSIFSGGRITGQTRAANAGRQAADIEVAAQRAQIALDVTQAYFDAALADRLVSIARSSLGQTEDVLRQTRLARQVGNQSEFELLRAQVTRDNQVPVLLQRTSDRQVAYLRLKQLLNIPLDDSLDLSTPVEDSTPVMPAGSLNGRALNAVTPDTTTSDRAPVRQAEASVRAQEGLLRVARGERLPQIAITSGYQRLFFPTSAFPDFGDYRQNWTVGIAAQLPLFSGGRIKGSTMIAEANLQEARARLQQTREVAALDTRIALNTYEQAEATWRASQGTAEQAARAYSIDQIRYSEGISTQTDLTQSRILLEQAVVNRVLAARDLAIARMRLTLLRDLPLQAGGSAAGAALNRSMGGAAGQGQQQPGQQQQRTMTQAASASSAGQIGGATP